MTITPVSVQKQVINYKRGMREETALRIYVSNFAYEMSEQQLREAFESHGQVQEVSIVHDRDSGRSRGFAFVEMPTGAEAQAAIAALNGKEIDGRVITVNEARPRPERTFGGSGGGSRGERRGGGFQNARKHPSRNPRW